MGNLDLRYGGKLKRLSHTGRWKRREEKSVIVSWRQRMKWKENEKGKKNQEEGERLEKKERGKKKEHIPK